MSHVERLLGVPLHIERSHIAIHPQNRNQLTVSARDIHEFVRLLPFGERQHDFLPCSICRRNISRRDHDRYMVMSVKVHSDHDRWRYDYETVIMHRTCFALHSEAARRRHGGA